MMKLKLIVVCAIYIIGTSAGPLPSYIQPCSRSLPTDQLTQCVTQQARSAQAEFSKGIPEYGVKPLDPLALADITAKAGTFIITSKNLILKGLKTMEIREIKFDLEKNTGSIKLFGNMTFKGDYETDGQLLLLPFKGNGKITVKAIDSDILIKYKLRTVRDANGVEHLETYDVRQSATYGRVIFRLTNLFGGNAISDSIHKVMNDNWQELMKELGPPYTKAVVDKFHEAIEQVYKNVPYEELFFP